MPRINLAVLDTLYLYYKFLQDKQIKYSAKYSARIFRRKNILIKEINKTEEKEILHRKKCTRIVIALPCYLFKTVITSITCHIRARMNLFAQRDVKFRESRNKRSTGTFINERRSSSSLFIAKYRKAK